RGPTRESGGLSSRGREALDAQPPRALRGDPATSQARGIPRRQDGAVRSDSYGAARDRPPARAVRGFGGRVFSTRLWRGGRPVPRREPEAGAFLRVAAEVLPMGGGQPRPR